MGWFSKQVPAASVSGTFLLLLAGCLPSAPSTSPLATWGRRGVSDGRFQKPRAIAVDRQDRLYIVDMTGRVQVFRPDGTFLLAWRTPDTRKGRPSGLSVDREGNVLVADSHYYRVLFYTPEGELLPQRTIGGRGGTGVGEFEYVTDAVQDSRGWYYVAEYGQNDRIQVFDRHGQYLLQFGGHGSAPGQFIRPQNLAVDHRDWIWVADACNHRIQAFYVDGDYRVHQMRLWGVQGSGPGELSYPYDLVVTGDGTVYVCEFGNHRVQKFTDRGESLGIWGGSGRSGEGLSGPWGLALDSRGRLHILDTYNHRVHTVRF